MASGKSDYVEVVYGEGIAPATDYPPALARYLAQRFAFKPGARLLDLGCGQGEMLAAFAALELGLELHAVDRAASVAGRLAASGIDFAASDFAVEVLPFDDASLDVVFAKSVIEHIHDPSWMLAEVRRVLCPDGVLIVLTPDWPSQIAVFYEDPTHIHPYQTKGLADLLAINDFRQARAERFAHHQWLWRPDLAGGLARGLARLLRLCLGTPAARRLSELSGCKFIRWSVELQILGSGRK